MIYLHGSPDSRLARHPDDDFTASMGVRLIAVDRPGFGHSHPHPNGTYGSLAADLGVLADELQLTRFSVLGWSAGCLPALALASAMHKRVSKVTIAAGLPPTRAYAEPGVLEGADQSRSMLVEIAQDLGAAAAASELAPYLLPLPIDFELARQHLLESADDLRRSELAAVPGLVDQMARSLVLAGRQGLTGITRDLELQLIEPDFDLATVGCPVSLYYGSADGSAPPSFGRWFADNLSAAQLHVFDGAGHCFLPAHWAEIVRN